MLTIETKGDRFQVLLASKPAYHTANEAVKVDATGSISGSLYGIKPSVMMSDAIQSPSSEPNWSRAYL